MYKRTEGFFQGHEDIKLYYQVWSQPSPQGHIVITHGQGEHSDCYNRLIDFFSESKSKNPWNFYAWDLRGHGRSEGRRGYATEFEDYCSDYLKFLDFILNEKSLQKGPIILLSHSMGGLIKTKTLMDNPRIIPQALVYSAPLFGVAVKVPAYKDHGAAFLNRWVPQITLGNEIDNSFLTRDKDVIREYEQDILRHTRISPGVYLGIKKTFDFVMPKAKKIRFPTLIQISETDQVVSYQKAKEFFSALESPIKKFISYNENAKHELYNDIIRRQVFTDLKEFAESFI